MAVINIAVCRGFAQQRLKVLLIHSLAGCVDLEWESHQFVTAYGYQLQLKTWDEKGGYWFSPVLTEIGWSMEHVLCGAPKRQRQNQIARGASFIFNMGQWGFLPVMEVQASVMRVLEDLEESPPVTCRWVVCSYQAFELYLLVGSICHPPYKFCTYLQMESDLNSAVIDLLSLPSFLTLRLVMISVAFCNSCLFFNPERCAGIS